MEITHFISSKEFYVQSHLVSLWLLFSYQNSITKRAQIMKKTQRIARTGHIYSLDLSSNKTHEETQRVFRLNSGPVKLYLEGSQLSFQIFELQFDVNVFLLHGLYIRFISIVIPKN